MRYELAGALEYVLDLLLNYPQGLSMLLGAIPLPSAMDIVLTFPARAPENLGIRNKYLRPIPEQERIVEAADRIDNIIGESGGWEHITRTIRDWAAKNNEDWSLMVDYIRHVRRSGYRWIGGAKLRRIAEVYGNSERTVRRKRRLFARELAEYILLSPIESLPAKSIKAVDSEEGRPADCRS
jgi:hypothetical protein